ncbi:MAG: hypothetical protein ACMG6S_08370 [Byssovorax sp.]
MPFKNLSGTRKHNDVQAEIRGSAILINPAVVAQLSTSPVRLVIQPVGGGSGKTTNVSLDSAEEVAMLSRDVALIRSGDDAVWALLGLTHSPKMDQVARDVRALCMRPTGETALALGWDGSATELRLNRHEVDARPFAVRGSIRAADLTETDTYTVVDGAGGGQLRVHPGATPEPGANARVDLPAEALAFDRIRGGARLSAVYKRGSATVCLVTGSPARYVTKLIQLEAKALDIAVMETSFVAAFADGRLALYDADAILMATDAGPIQPHFVLPLGTRGEPRTVTVIGKGSPTIWIGTSAGAARSVAAVRKQAM